MSDWTKDFGQSMDSYISAKRFDGEGAILKYKSYMKVEPDDLEYTIGGTQNKKIKNSKGKLLLDKDGKEIVNKYYDAKFPNGYQIKFEFDQGTLSCTSYPMLKEMHRVGPVEGDTLHIKRDASVQTETTYCIVRVDTP